MKQLVRVMPVEYRRALKELAANADAEPKRSTMVLLDQLPGSKLPGRHGLGATIRQHVHGTMSVEIDDDGAVALPLAPRPVVDPHDARHGPILLARPERIETEADIAGRGGEALALHIFGDVDRGHP